MINSHFIKSYESGIITLTINTKERWLDYHRYSDELFEVEDYQGNKFSLVVKLPLQEKDQIIYYYIPLYLIMEKDKWDKIKEKL